MEYDGSPRQGTRPRAQGSAARSLGLFRRVRREGHGLRLAVPPEVVAALGLVEGHHVYFALGGDGTVRLVNVATLVDPAAGVLGESESRAALLAENRRLRRKLAARRFLVGAYMYHQGRQDQYFRSGGLSSPAGASGEQGTAGANGHAACTGWRPSPAT